LALGSGGGLGLDFHGRVESSRALFELSELWRGGVRGQLLLEGGELALEGGDFFLAGDQLLLRACELDFAAHEGHDLGLGEAGLVFQELRCDAEVDGRGAVGDERFGALEGG